MKVAYVDTSCLVAIAFGEKGAVALGRRLERFERLVSSNLLEAELRASLVREGVPADVEFLSWITWLLPDRPLSREITAILSVGYLRGADLWHLACALYLVDSPRDMSFITLDDRQGAVAKQLGFLT
ncbi:MAG: PIN domain-containing protein [Gemmatimonadales bacterium]